MKSSEIWIDPRISVSPGEPQWNQMVIIAGMAHNTTYDASLKCFPTDTWKSRILHSALDLKLANSIRPTNQLTNKKLKDVLRSQRETPGKR